MPGTPSGGKKAARTIKELYGADFFKEIASLGGRARVPKGFAVNPDLARSAGAKGGRISKRRAKKAA